MQSEKNILTIVREVVNGTLNVQDEDDLFDSGATSLTVVDLQIRLEERLSLRTATSQLMRSPTIKDWAKIYQGVQAEPTPN